MKIVITGSRDFSDRKFLFTYLDRFHSLHSISHLIQGGARGVDSLSREWAIARNVRWSEYLADWRMYGKFAGHLRNQQMINQSPDAVIAFFSDPKNPSSGTSDCVARAKLAAIPVYFAHELDNLK